MKNYIYKYDGQPIRRSEFLAEVPESWEMDVEDGEYSYGLYTAIEVE